MAGGELFIKTGHVVIRVQPNGATYQVFILDDTVSKPTIIKIFGPYESN